MIKNIIPENGPIFPQIDRKKNETLIYNHGSKVATVLMYIMYIILLSGKSFQVSPELFYNVSIIGTGIALLCSLYSLIWYAIKYRNFQVPSEVSFKVSVKKIFKALIYLFLCLLSVIFYAKKLPLFGYNIVGEAALFLWVLCIGSFVTLLFSMFFVNIVGLIKSIISFK